MGETIAARAWRDAQADALETRAEAIEGAILGLDALDGMFEERAEIRDASRVARGLLEVEAGNLRTQAGKLRGGRGDEPAERALEAVS